MPLPLAHKLPGGGGRDRERGDAMRRVPPGVGRVRAGDDGDRRRQRGNRRIYTLAELLLDAFGPKHLAGD